MARSVSAMLVLGFLVVAAFYMSEASAKDSKGGLLKAKVKISFFNKCGNDVRLEVGLGKLHCKKGKKALLGPVDVDLEVHSLLKVKLFLFDKYGKKIKLKFFVKLDLGLLGKLVDGFTELFLDLVEEIVEGVDGKVIKLLCGEVELAKFNI